MTKIQYILKLEEGGKYSIYLKEYGLSETAPHIPRATTVAEPTLACTFDYMSQDILEFAKKFYPSARWVRVTSTIEIEEV